jgi:hypothetical protein
MQLWKRKRAEIAIERGSSSFGFSLCFCHFFVHDLQLCTMFTVGK